MQMQKLYREIGHNHLFKSPFGIVVEVT